MSLSRLAGAVAKEGGVGVISTAQIGFEEPEFEKDILENIISKRSHRRPDTWQIQKSMILCAVMKEI